MNLNFVERPPQPGPAQPSPQPRPAQPQQVTSTSEKVKTRVFTFDITKKKAIIFLLVFLTITISVLVSLLVTKPWEEKEKEDEKTDEVESSSESDDTSRSNSSSLVQSVVQSVMSFTPLGRQPSTCANGYINLNSGDLLSPSTTLVCVPGHIKVIVQGLPTETSVDLCLIPNGNPQLPTYEGNTGLTGRLEYSTSESRWNLKVGTLQYYLLNQVFSTNVPVGTKVWVSSDMSSRYIVIQVHNDPCSQFSTSTYNRDYADTSDTIPYYANDNKYYANHNSEWRSWKQGNNALAYGPNITSLSECVSKLRDDKFIETEDNIRSWDINRRTVTHPNYPKDAAGNKVTVSSPLQNLINSFNHFVVEYRKPTNPKNRINTVDSWGNCVLKGVTKTEKVEFSDSTNDQVTSKFAKSVISA